VPGVFPAPTLWKGLKALKETVKYTMYHEHNPRTGRGRVRLVPGHRIRVDCPLGQFHKIRRLHRCRNWRINPDLGHVENGDYIDILPK